MNKTWLVAVVLVVAVAAVAAATGTSETPAVTAGPVTFTWYIEAPSATQIKSRDEMPAVREAEKRTGVHIEWQQPAKGALAEQFNLIVASGDYPDLLWYDWATVPGGAQKFLDDGVVVGLNDLVDKYAPNLNAYLKANPDVKKSLTSAKGSLYVFPFTTESAIKDGYYGLMLRKQWLARLNLAVPTTIDEWHTVLTAFKTQDANGNGDPNDEIPFLSRAGGGSMVFFAGAFGVMNDFFVDDKGTVRFGSIEPGFRQWLQTMAQWYKEGLIDQDFATNSSKRSDSLFIDDKAGAVGEFVTRTFGRLMDLARPTRPDFSFVAAPWPLGPAGKRLLSWRSDTKLYWTRGVAVTTKCKDPARAVQYLDFWFSSDGERLLNYGVEGDTYTMVNGKPTYNDKILKNPNGYTSSETRAMFLPVTDDMVGIERAGGFMQFLTYPEAIQAMEKVWPANDGALGLPQLTLADADAQRVAKLMGDINTYRDENMNKMIMGQLAMSDFDGYVATIKKMGIDEVVRIYQAAMDAYSAR